VPPEVSLSVAPEGEMAEGFQMSIGPDLNEVVRVNQTFADFADSHALPTAVRRSVNVALDELLTNTVNYGFLKRSDGALSIEVDLQPDRLTLTLIDNGAPFDPWIRIAPDTTLSMESRRIGGLGIHLVKKMMDESRYEYRDGKNIVVLVKQVLPENG
jgi:anti-sigma regulatory factor (Ser/Thr protein kinase)